MSAHTPGPWKAMDWDGDTCLVEALTSDEKMVTREICHVLNPEDDQPTTKANLSLIAAAPDLLAALRLMVRDNDGTNDGVADLAVAAAAIAKAEGKS